jgi:hypothetical protein
MRGPTEAESPRRVRPIVAVARLAGKERVAPTTESVNRFRNPDGPTPSPHQGQWYAASGVSMTERA